MSPAEFRELGARLFARPGARTPHGWQARAAAHFAVTDRTIRAWVAGRDPVPAGISREMRAMIAVAPPPPGTTADDDRDDAMRDALDPALERVLSEYEAAGWSEAEIIVAMLAFAAQRMRDRAGAPATIETIAQAITDII